MPVLGIWMPKEVSKRFMFSSALLNICKKVLGIFLAPATIDYVAYMEEPALTTLILIRNIQTEQYIFIFQVNLFDFNHFRTKNIRFMFNYFITTVFWQTHFFYFIFFFLLISLCWMIKKQWNSTEMFHKCYTVTSN